MRKNIYLDGLKMRIFLPLYIIHTLTALITVNQENRNQPLLLEKTNSQVSKTAKVGCLFPMVILAVFRTRQNIDDDCRKEAPHLICNKGYHIRVTHHKN